MGRPRERDATESTSPTEQPNPRTTGLDRMAPEAILARILDEDELAAAAVRSALPALERAAELLHAALAGGGRWFNVGAGTSGRLGLLDAAELPPTFGIDPASVQAVLAGGAAAFERAVEGAEDDADAARAELERRGLRAGDVVLALSASGSTPFALGAVARAREVGAKTIGVTCAADSALARAVDVPIVVPVGPEVIAGSTRMKGGLAQKMVLHALSTTVMVRLGRVRGNLMAEIRGASRKLRERGIRIVARLARVPPEEAARVLDDCGGSVPDALERLRVPRRRPS
jgi:N-acetylmuramic acid 6-phosphate etherase